MLVETAARLRRSVRTGDVVGRFAGDEFVVICERLERPADAEMVAAELAAALRVPMQLDGGRRDISGSIGVALAGPPHSVDERVLLREADAAMYEAKRTGSDVVVYAEHLGARAVARADSEQRLRQAIDGGELLAHYQPILADGEVVAVEALARWQHPERGLLAPGAFLEDARHAGLLSRLGETVLREACAQTAAWNRDRLRPLRVQVNVAEQQLLDAAFPGVVAAVVAETGLDPRLLTLEITEDVALERLGPELSVLRQLRALGVTLSVDDFGLGRSTFAALRALDMVSELKIDRSFVSGIDASTTDQALVRAMVGLAGEVGLHVVAEGVETPAELRELSRLGVHTVQGFHLARPAAASDVELLLAPLADAA